MFPTAVLLTAFEECLRKAHYMRRYRRAKFSGNEMLQAAIRAGLLSERADFGEAAGEEVYAMGAEPGLDTEHYDVHGEVCHLACLADVVTCALRKPGDAPWDLPPEQPLWTPSCYLSSDGLHLRRVVLASSWNDDRHYSECRSWFSLGEVCRYGLPMQMAVIVLGQSRGGKRHGPWARALRHPANKTLRFRKKHAVSEGFKNTWLDVWREDYDDISTQDWLQGMLNDGVLQDVCFMVEIPVPGEVARQKVLDMGTRKLETLENMKELPDPQLTGCDWPQPCAFRTPCHGGREPQKGVFRILD